MHDSDPGRPDADEGQPYYFQYIKLVPDGHVVDTLERQIAERGVPRHLHAATGAAAGGARRVEPLEIVGHVADVERVFSYRAPPHRARRPRDVDQGRVRAVRSRRRLRGRPLADIVAELTAVRAAFVAFLRGLDAAAWLRRAADDFTLRSVRAIAYCVAGHELHHLADIRRQHGG